MKNSNFLQLSFHWAHTNLPFWGQTHWRNCLDYELIEGNYIYNDLPLFDKKTSFEHLRRSFRRHFVPYCSRNIKALYLSFSKIFVSLIVFLRSLSPLPPFLAGFLLDLLAFLVACLQILLFLTVWADIRFWSRNSNLILLPDWPWLISDFFPVIVCFIVDFLHYEKQNK